MKIDDPKPSSAPSLEEVDVHFTYQGRSQDETFFMTKDGKHIVRGVVYDLGQNPFQEDLDKLKTSGAPSFGRPTPRSRWSSSAISNAPIARKKPRHCATTSRRNFPPRFTCTSRISRWSRSIPGPRPRPSQDDASFIKAPAAFWKYHDWIYDHQADITPDNLKTQVMDFAKTAPDIDALQLGHCIDTKATEAEVDASLAEGRALHVDATPTLVSERPPLDRQLSLAEYRPDHQRRTELSKDRAKHPAKTEKTDDKCCEVKIPSAARTNNMRLRSVLLIALLIALAAGLFAANISSDEYLGIVKFLASQEMRGRATGSPELEKAAAYIRDQFRGMNLKPLSGDSYYQDFDVTTSARLGKKNDLSLALGRRRPAIAALRAGLHPVESFRRRRSFRQRGLRGLWHHRARIQLRRLRGPGREGQNRPGAAP